MGGRPKAFLVYELVSNALDEATNRIDVTIEKLPGRPAAHLVVRDDNPYGFADLRHAFTLFAESRKKSNPEQRGRFNLGEKLVLSLCREAEIRTTTGTIEFSPDGRRLESGRRRTARGSVFEATVDMTQAEFGHEVERNHLSTRYHDALTRFGGQLTDLALRDPVLFD